MSLRTPTAIVSIMAIDRNEASPEVAVVTLVGRILLGEQVEQIGQVADELLSAGMRIVVFDLGSITTIESTDTVLSFYSTVADALKT